MAIGVIGMLRWLRQLGRAEVARHSTTTSTRAAVDESVYELPFDLGRRYSVIQGYGGSYSHAGKFHFAIDFDMPERSRICAARSGTVFRVIDMYDQGGAHPVFKPKSNSIYVLHADDTMACYAHLAEGGARVWHGQRVVAGQLIGLSGNTGWSSLPHLHFHVADPVTHQTFAIKFMTAESGAIQVKQGGSYSRPAPLRQDGHRFDSDEPIEVCHQPATHRDPYVFAADLFALREEVAESLAADGHAMWDDFGSIDIMHDVYGLEVCGIRDLETTIQVTRLLMGHFPGWIPGWFFPPDGSSSQGWVARIQRDQDSPAEYWESE